MRNEEKRWREKKSKIKKKENGKWRKSTKEPKKRDETRER